MNLDDFKLADLEWKQLPEELNGALGFMAWSFGGVLAGTVLGMGVLAFLGEPAGVVLALILIFGPLIVYLYSMYSVWSAIGAVPLADESQRSRMRTTLVLLGPIAFIMLSMMPDKESLQAGSGFSRWPPVGLLVFGLGLGAQQFYSIMSGGRYAPVLLLLLPVLVLMGMVGIVDPETLWANHMKKKGLEVSSTRLLVANSAGGLGLLIGAGLLFMLMR